jgi:type I restriction enzyme S subunit
MSKELHFKQTHIGSIPEDWDVSSIGDIASPDKYSLSMGPFGSNITKDNFLPHGVPVIRGNNLTEFRFADKDFVFLSEKKADELLSSNAKANDIIVTHRGTLGQVGIIPRKSKYKRYVVSQSGMKLTCDTSKVDAEFVFYWLKSPRGQQELLKNTSQTGVPAIAQPLSSLRKIALPRPPLNEQHSIARIFADLDMKIELNKRENQNLEAIGQAIFKRWFVDFEFPNEEGKPYKSSGGEVVDSTLGEIPSGWKTGGLGDICEITMGQSPPGETYNEISEGVPFFQGIRDFGFRFPSKRVYCVAPTRFAQEGDVLLSVRAPVGSLNIADVRCAIGRGVAALRLKEKQNSFLYYLLLATRSAWDQYDAKGTVFGSATKQDVHDFKIIIPPKDLRDQFGELIEPLDQKILLNEKESRNLAAVRDSLLPRLMSGKIRVPVTKENVEAQRCLR